MPYESLKSGLGNWNRCGQSENLAVFASGLAAIVLFGFLAFLSIFKV